MRKTILTLLAGIAYCLCANGQVLYPNHYNGDYLKLLELENEGFNTGITLYPSIISQYAPDSALKSDVWKGRFKFLDFRDKKVQILDPTWNVSFNSKYARGYNDGAQWQGKGLNSVLNLGIAGRFGMLHFTFAPVIYAAQNTDFQIADSSFPKNEFAYPFLGGIDWVQRYGNEAVYDFHFGQSEIRLVQKNVTLGISTQNMSWGPSQFNPIIMSSNAGGFPHIDLGTNVPVQTAIGDIEFKSFWGILSESDYYDNIEDNDQRYITGFVLGYRPSFIKGLSIGFNRVLYQRSRDFDFKDIFSGFSEFFSAVDEELDGRPVNDAYDQMGSFMLKWEFKEIGFESYVEFARNDFSGNITDLLIQPGHSRAYTFGFIKTGRLWDNPIKFTYEHTNLGNSRTKLIRATPTYYVHHIVSQGYTNNGQILGAGIGPGANSDQIEFKYYKPDGALGFDFQRVRFNDDYFFSNFVQLGVNNMDVEYNFGLNYLKFIGKTSIQAGFLYSIRTSWQFQDGNNVGNVNLYFSLTRNIN
jgi:hypothetical protein